MTDICEIIYSAVSIAKNRLITRNLTQFTGTVQFVMSTECQNA